MGAKPWATLAAGGPAAQRHASLVREEIHRGFGCLNVRPESRCQTLRVRCEDGITVVSNGLMSAVQAVLTPDVFREGESGTVTRVGRPKLPSLSLPSDRALAVTALVFALILRSLIPVGFMPAQDPAANGGFGFVICDGADPLSSQPTQDGDQAAPDRCPFGLHARTILAFAESPPHPVRFDRVLGVVTAPVDIDRAGQRKDFRERARSPPAIG